MTNTEQVLPDHFKFVTSSRIPHTAKRRGTEYEISWVSAYSSELRFTHYPVSDVESCVREGSWIITSKQDQTKAPQDSLLSRIKTFTERVSQASVRVYKDHYEVYYDDFAVNAPSDEELEKLMNAIVVLDEATRG